MTSAYTIENCRNCLTRHIKLSKIKYSDRVAETCEACDRGRTCGVSSFFILWGLQLTPGQESASDVCLCDGEQVEEVYL